MSTAAKPKTVRAACIQITAGREIGPNVTRALELMAEAKAAGADLIALPENATMIEPVAAQALDKALPESKHPGLSAIQAFARDNEVWILVGSLSIRDPHAEKIANRSFLIDASGAIAARYDKLHLFDVNLRDDEWYRESDNIRPGGEAVVAPTPWGVMGLTICYDLRFPQLYRALAHAGAGLITVPSAFTVTTGKAHWHVLLRARAIETGCFVLAPAQWGDHAEGRKTYGHSLIVNPWGEIIAEAPDGEGVITADLDLSEVPAPANASPASTTTATSTALARRRTRGWSRTG